MDILTNTFNNRELANFLWGFVLIVISLFFKQTRSLVANFFKAFFSIKILRIFLIMIIYISLQVLLLYRVKLWDFGLLKDTIYWLIGGAFILLVNVNNVTREKQYFKNLLVSNLTVMVIIEFILNLYTFPFIVEIIVLPFITIIYLIDIYYQKREYTSKKNIASYLVVLYGFIIFIFSIVSVISDFDNVWTLNNLRAFLLPILLLITFIPFLYFLAIYIVYELLFIRLDKILKIDKAISRYEKKKILVLCNINLMRLNKFVKESTTQLTRFDSTDEIQKIVNDFKKSN